MQQAAADPSLYGALEAGTQVCRHAVGCDTPNASEVRADEIKKTL